MIGLFLSLSVILLFLCVVPRKKKIVIKFLEWILWLATFATALAFTFAVAKIFSSDTAVIKMLIGWSVVPMLGIHWVAIRFIIFLLKKGRMCEPIQKFFSSLMKNPFKWQRLNGSTETTGHPKISTCLRKTVCTATLLFVLVIGIIDFVIIAGIITFYEMLHRLPSK